MNFLYILYLPNGAGAPLAAAGGVTVCFEDLSGGVVPIRRIVVERSTAVGRRIWGTMPDVVHKLRADLARAERKYEP